MTESIDVDALERCLFDTCDYANALQVERMNAVVAALRQQQLMLEVKDTAIGQIRVGEEWNVNEIARLTKIKDGDTAEFQRMDKALDEFNAENMRLRAALTRLVFVVETCEEHSYHAALEAGNKALEEK